MGIKYHVRYQEEVMRHHIPSLPLTIKARIKNAIEERLTIDPVGLGKPLRYTLKGFRRLRVGDYRIVYEIIPAEHTVLIIAIKHRKEIYGHHYGGPHS